MVGDFCYFTERKSNYNSNNKSKYRTLFTLDCRGPKIFFKIFVAIILEICILIIKTNKEHYMPTKAVSPDLAEAINHLISLLQRDYGCDYSYSINGNGFTLAQSNIAGVNLPTPIVDESSKNLKKDITTVNVTTKMGNTLQFFYNPTNSLVVVDLVNADATGGNEIFRQKINEKQLLKHC